MLIKDPTTETLIKNLGFLQLISCNPVSLVSLLELSLVTYQNSSGGLVSELCHCVLGHHGMR